MGITNQAITQEFLMKDDTLDTVISNLPTNMLINNCNML